MWFYQFALGYMQVNHGSGYFGMAKQVFQSNDVQSFLKQVGGVSMPECMQVYPFTY